MIESRICDMLGADAIQVGTRFLSAEECTVHEEYKSKTPFSKTFARMESDPDVRPEDILAFGSGALRKAVQEGDRNGSYMAGECAGMVHRIEPAKDIVEDLMIGAEQVIKNFNSRIR